MTRTSGSMRKLPTATTTAHFARGRSFVLNTNRQLFEQELSLPLRTLLPTRSLAQVRHEPLSEFWFTPSSPARSPADDLLGNSSGRNGHHNPPDERTLKLGKTLRTLSPLLPNILAQPLPPTILSPSISLHLFPSTHPHLPAVKGKVPYRAALWTAPVAWGCVPLVGNVKLQILSEKIVRTGFISQLRLSEETRSGLGDEKLVVRWKTEKTGSSGSSSNDSTLSNSANSTTATTTVRGRTAYSSAGLNRGLSKLLGGEKPIFNLNQGDDFSGMFIFTFDAEGRIATHTIEHADENNSMDKTSKVVTLADWLLGRAKWRSSRKEQEELIPGLAMNLRLCQEEWAREGRIGASASRARFGVADAG